MITTTSMCTLYSSPPPPGTEPRTTGCGVSQDWYQYGHHNQTDRAALRFRRQRPRLQVVQLQNLRLSTFCRPKLRFHIIRLQRLCLPRFRLPRFRLPRFRLLIICLQRLCLQRFCLQIICFQRLHLPTFRLQRFRLQIIRRQRLCLQTSGGAKPLCIGQLSRLLTPMARQQYLKSKLNPIMG